MTVNDQLHGTVVHVHPDTICLIGGQNCIGFISEANTELNDYYVDFQVKTGLYPLDALSTLLPNQQLTEKLAPFKTSNPEAMQEIETYLYQDDGWSKYCLLRTAKAHPEIFKTCLQPLSAYLSANQLYHQYRA